MLRQARENALISVLSLEGEAEENSGRETLTRLHFSLARFGRGLG